MIYSESANLRHTPEALWFVFWLLRNSRDKINQITSPPPNDPRSAAFASHSEVMRGLMKKRCHLRNKYHAQIKQWRAECGIKGDGDHVSTADLVGGRAGHARGGEGEGHSYMIVVVVGVQRDGGSGGRESCEGGVSPLLAAQTWGRVPVHKPGTGCRKAGWARKTWGFDRSAGAEDQRQSGGKCRGLTESRRVYEGLCGADKR